MKIRMSHKTEGLLMGLWKFIRSFLEVCVICIGGKYYTNEDKSVEEEVVIEKTGELIQTKK